MHNLTIEHLVPFILHHRDIGYILLFFMMVLEGEVFLIISATLVHLGAFGLVDVFLISLSGVIVGNMLWYYLGMMMGTYDFTKKIIIHAEKTLLYFLPNFRERPFSSIFISKFIYGINHAMVIMAGVFRVRLSLFLKAETLASVIWVVLQMSVGYFFGYAAVRITHNVSRFAFIMGAFVVAFILLQKLFVYLYERHEYSSLKEDSNA